MEPLLILRIIAWTIAISLIGSSFIKLINLDGLKGAKRVALSYWLGYTIYGTIALILCSIGKFDYSSSLYIFALAIPPLFWKRTSNSKHNSKFSIFSLLFVLLALLNLPSSLVSPVDTQALTTFLWLPQLYAENIMLDNSLAITPPSLSYMVSAGAFTLGGEGLLLLHSWSVGIMAAVAIYAIARQRMRPAPAWIFTALIYTIPMFVAGSATGLPEVALIGLVAMASSSLIYYYNSSRKRWLIASAILTGATIATSFYGLLIAISLTATLLWLIKNQSPIKVVKHTTIFAIITLAFGIIHYSGDFSLAHWNGASNWSETQTNFYNQLHLQDAASKKEASSIVGYPIEATFNAEKFSSPIFGLGALFLIALIPSLLIFLRRFPFISWNYRIGSMESYVFIFLIYYGLWFYYGVSLDSKYLLPVLPLLVLPTWICGLQSSSRSSNKINYALYGLLATILLSQIFIMLTMNGSAIGTLFHKNTQTKYLEQNIATYNTHKYLLSNLKDDEKVMHTELGSLNYYLGESVVYANAETQEIIPISHEDSVKVLNAIMKEKVAYWVTRNDPMDSIFDTSINGHSMLRKLVSYGCFKLDKQINGIVKDKSSLLNSDNSQYEVTHHIYKFIPKCSGK